MKDTFNAVGFKDIKARRAPMAAAEDYRVSDPGLANDIFERLSTVEYQ